MKSCAASSGSTIRETGSAGAARLHRASVSPLPPYSDLTADGASYEYHTAPNHGGADQGCQRGRDGRRSEPEDSQLCCANHSASNESNDSNGAQ